MTVPPRLGLVTLACRDIERMAAIFRALGWPEAPSSDERRAPRALRFWGGGFSWRDPEGNIWDVAWANGSEFDERGGLRFP